VVADKAIDELDGLVVTKNLHVKNVVEVSEIEVSDFTAHPCCC
jgi:hypothetical protein